MRRHPDILLHDLDGRLRNVNEFIGHGQWVVVAFWMHDCKVCASEIHHMSAFHKAHQTKDAIVLGISIDGAALAGEAKYFVAIHQFLFPTHTIGQNGRVKRMPGGDSLREKHGP